MKLTPIVFLLSSLLLVAISCKKKVNTVTPQSKDITEVVYASGVLEPQNQFILYSLADGTIAEIFVAEGDTIGTSQPLLRVDGNATEARLYSAEEIYKTAQQNYGENSPALQELKTQLNTLKSRLQIDSTNYVRYKRLYNENAIKKSDFEKAELTYINSQNDYKATKQRIENLRAQLYVTLQNAQSQYKITQDDVANYLVKSGTKGRVYDLLKEKGEVVRRSEAIAIIGDAENVVLKMSVDESDIEKIKIGQQVLVQIEAYGEKIFKAKVTRIYPAMNKKDFAFRVDAAMIETLPAIFSGTNIEANIIIQEKKNVLCLPKSVMMPGDTVLVKTADGDKKVKVQKGIENFEYIEVTGGVDANTQIITK
ncbi:MAG: efflux RND transporter periplasmic adaptor subunit [Bacteroidetes bacterium]|nr:MAG: efflux RND transporter periplasmic adaptor subunit [Bacteroidota bacterium]